MILIQSYNIAGALVVLRQLPLEEQRVHEALSGEPFDADETAVSTFHYPGLHWVGVDEHKDPVAVGGFIRQRPGVFRTWFFATDAAWKVQGLTSAVRAYIQRMLVKDAHRIETVTLARCSKAQEWYGRIGLQHESTLRGYAANGEDAVIYVALRPVENI